RISFRIASFAHKSAKTHLIKTIERVLRNAPVGRAIATRQRRARLARSRRGAASGARGAGCAQTPRTSVPGSGRCTSVPGGGRWPSLETDVDHPRPRGGCDRAYFG